MATAGPAVDLEPLGLGQEGGFLLVAGGDHAAVARQHHLAHPVAPAQFLDLALHGGRILRVAGKHLHGHRAAADVGQQSDDHLLEAALAIAAMAELCTSPPAPDAPSKELLVMS